MPSLPSSATTSAGDWTVERRDYGWCGHFRAMASPCEVHVSGASRAAAEDIVVAVCTEARRVESKFSRYRDGNVVDRINRANGAAVRVDGETARLLDYAGELFALSEGRFDITSGILRRAWTFDGGEGVPCPEQIAELRHQVGWNRLSWQRPVLRMPAGMEIDFGGIGKEYAVDRAADIVRKHSTSCMINFGGDLIALGPPAATRRNGGGWTVGIESLTGSPATQRIALQFGALATSGDTRRYQISNGQRYGHILDARTGWPVVGAPHSITVLGPTCTQSGMLATFAMLMGDQAETFLESQHMKFWIQR